MNKVLIGAFSLVAATALTACGSSSNAKSAGTTTTPTPTSSSTPAGSGGGSGADAVKALIKAEILKSQSSSTANPFKMTDAQAGCTANSVVDAVGVDKLHTYGILTADNKLTTKKLTATTFSTADATAVVNAILQCVGDANFTNALKRSIDASLPASLPAAQRACIDGKFTADAVKRAIIAELSGQTAAAAQLTTSVEACMR